MSEMSKFLGFECALFLLQGLLLYFLKGSVPRCEKFPQAVKQEQAPLLFRCGALLIVPVVTVFFMPAAQRFQGVLLSRNPRPTIALETLLANYNGLNPDNSSVVFMTNRLRQFEKDLARGVSENASYASDYYGILREHGVSTAAALKNPETALAVLREVAPIVGGFYFAKAEAVTDAGAKVATADYNSAARYVNKKKWQRTFFATGTEAYLGIGEGLFLLNATTTVDTRFMSAHPLLTNLYIMPHYYFTNAKYDASCPWNLKAADILDPDTRKVFDIGGIDIFAVDPLEYAGLPEKDGLLSLSAAGEVKTKGPAFILLENQRSYGLAYVAHRITYAGTGTTARFFSLFRPPFVGRESTPEFHAYKEEVGRLRNALLNLKSKFDILVEDDEKSREPGFEICDRLANRLEIGNFIGNRAVFRVECGASPCVMVFNAAWLKGWRAFSDRRSLSIRRANFAFMSVAVPPGRHLVWFEYRPFWARAGSLLTLAFFAAFFLWFLFGTPRTTDP